MNDESDLTQLQTITIGQYTLAGDDYSSETNVFIMKSMNDNDD